MFCYKCGAQLPDDSKFCFKCGVSLSMPAEPKVLPAENVPTRAEGNDASATGVIEEKSAVNPAKAAGKCSGFFASLKKKKYLKPVFIVVVTVALLCAAAYGICAWVGIRQCEQLVVTIPDPETYLGIEMYSRTRHNQYEYYITCYPDDLPDLRLEDYVDLLIDQYDFDYTWNEGPKEDRYRHTITHSLSYQAIPPLAAWAYDNYWSTVKPLVNIRYEHKHPGKEYDTIEVQITIFPPKQFDIISAEVHPGV